MFGDAATPGENLHTGWEKTNAAAFTSDKEEYDYTRALDAASDRVRVVEIGRTVLGRPINMFIIGLPAPRPTAAAVSDNPAALLNCNVHGNEPSSREGCLIVARELAFSDDPRTLDLLRNMNVLIKVQQHGPRGWFVSMKQPLRGLVPLLLDGEAAEPMVSGRRVAC